MSRHWSRSMWSEVFAVGLAWDIPILLLRLLRVDREPFSPPPAAVASSGVCRIGVFVVLPRLPLADGDCIGSRPCVQIQVGGGHLDGELADADHVSACTAWPTIVLVHWRFRLGRYGCVRFLLLGALRGGLLRLGVFFLVVVLGVFVLELLWSSSASDNSLSLLSARVILVNSSIINDASALAPRTVCLTLDSDAFDWLEIVSELSVALECESAAGLAEGSWNGPRLPTLPLENCFDESIPVRSWVDLAKPGAAILFSITFSTDKNCNSAPSNHTLTSYSASSEDLGGVKLVGGGGCRCGRGCSGRHFCCRLHGRFIV
ncbi:hypothetical protein pipiens_017668 [Culex pipiens pipiens]|uniref:Uncharacterized protein n=1 Tax=Culex pipiens pipiens TaxID=38569 RepID=A0ABD1CGL8_CULPP